MLGTRHAETIEDMDRVIGEQTARIEELTLKNSDLTMANEAYAGGTRHLKGRIGKLERALEDAPPVTNMNTLGYVRWFNDIRNAVLKKESP